MIVTVSSTGKMASKLLSYAWLLVLVGVAWWFASAASESVFFPPLGNIMERFQVVWLNNVGARHLMASVSNFLIGFIAAAVLGILFGIILWRLPRLNDSMTWLVYFMYVIPTVALLPALVLLLGIEDRLKITVVILAAIWPTLLNTIDGLRSLDEVKLFTASALRMNDLQKVWWVVLPNALPQIMAGLRHSLQIAVIMIVVSEMTASTEGVGFRILEFQHTFRYTDMWTGIFMLAFLGLAASGLFSLFEHFMLKWYRGSKSGGRS